ncbi:GspH/FimT family pseudopilin [Candidatus Albibeggiatoa sp. nov. NOAA]|uniref:GspH/FimT family pseudopilin n=1 Tax=Candidatus Albibeggiatoa sp. nov. NOAA TaxID=3162724 RepID=UPI003301C28A|nr:GspH/FimT family pseudopilin [Thiotrichaceae bacterium]
MNKQRAFTITELMITVAIVGILVSVALPSLRHSLLNNRITAKTNQFVSVLNYARSESIIGRNIRIEPLNKISTSDEWGHGWVVADDANDNGEIDCTNLWDADCEKLREFKFDDGIEVNGPDELDIILYDSRGQLAGNASKLNMSFVFCLENATENDPTGREVTIQATGRTALTNREYPCAKP